MFSYDLCEIYKNTFFTEQLRTIALDYIKAKGWIFQAHEKVTL